MNIVKKLIKTEYVDCASPEVRIREAESQIETILNHYGCKLGISLINLNGKNIHQEIVVIDRRD